MIDEATQELASLYALGLLGPEETTAFEARLATDGELVELAARLQGAAVAVARAVPPVEPPPALRTHLLGRIRPETISAAPSRGTSERWIMAASIAVLVGVAGMGWWSVEQQGKAFDKLAHADMSARAVAQAEESALRSKIVALEGAQSTAEASRQSVQKEMAELRDQLEASQKEVASLQTQDQLAQIKIAMLSSIGQKMPKALAIVAWDAGRQHGMLKPMHMPTAAPDQDYQLWIIDPAYKQPVSAGVFQGGNEASSSEFKPVQPIASASKFAISVEKKGGAPAPTGPVVLLSE